MLHKIYWKLEITVLLNIAQGAIDDHARSPEVFCAKRHQAPVTGIDMRRGLGDEHDGVSRDLVNLEPDVSECSHAHKKKGDSIRHRH